MKKSQAEIVVALQAAAEANDFPAADALLADYAAIRAAHPNIVMIAIGFKQLARRAFASNRMEGLEWLLTLDHFQTMEHTLELTELTAEQKWEAGTRKILSTIPNLEGTTTSGDLKAILKTGHEESALAALEMGMPWRGGAPGDDLGLLLGAAMENHATMLAALQEKGADLHGVFSLDVFESGEFLEANLLFFAAMNPAEETVAFLVSQGVALHSPGEKWLKGEIFSIDQIGHFPFLYFDVGGDINAFQDYEISEYFKKPLPDPQKRTSGENGFGTIADLGYDLRPLLKEMHADPERFEEKSELTELLTGHLRDMARLSAMFTQCLETAALKNGEDPASSFTVTTPLNPKPHANAPLLRFAGAGMLGDLFQPEHWHSLPPAAVFAFRDRLAELLPAYHQPQLAGVDLTWANVARDGADGEKTWQKTVQAPCAIPQNQR